jgi:hypothetical protein
MLPFRTHQRYACKDGRGTGVTRTKHFTASACMTSPCLAPLCAVLSLSDRRSLIQGIDGDSRGALRRCSLSKARTCTQHFSMSVAASPLLLLFHSFDQKNKSKRRRRTYSAQEAAMRRAALARCKDNSLFFPSFGGSRVLSLAGHPQCSTVRHDVPLLACCLAQTQDPSFTDVVADPLDHGVGAAQLASPRPSYPVAEDAHIPPGHIHATGRPARWRPSAR